MTRKSPVFWSLLAALGALGTSAHAAFEGDLVPRLQGSILAIDGESDDDGSVAANVHVFQYTLGDAPGFTQDPGLKPLAGSGLNSLYEGFNIVGPLRYWNGVGAPVLTADTANARLEFYLGASTAFVSGTTVSQNGFVIEHLAANGSGHEHLSTQLLGVPSAAGTYLDSTGAKYLAPADGIYAVPIKITASTTSTTNPATYLSDTVWLVYNQGLTDSQLSAGASAVPEPAALSVLGLGSLHLLKRRK